MPSVNTKSDEIAFEDLHDAILDEISVTWGELARLQIRMLLNEAYVKPRSTVLLIAEGLKSLTCPQENPWGPSDFVNSVSEMDSLAKDYHRVAIEMQSGDVIEVEAKSIKLRMSVDSPKGT